MTLKKIKIRKIAIWSDFFWCRLSEVNKEVKTRKNHEIDFIDDYKIVNLPRNMFVPTQEFLEEMVEDCFV